MKQPIGWVLAAALSSSVLLDSIRQQTTVIVSCPYCPTAEQKAILNKMSLADIPAGGALAYEAVRLQGNLQIVNGLDDTATTNGFGNLYLGYPTSNASAGRSKAASRGRVKAGQLKSARDAEVILQ